MKAKKCRALGCNRKTRTPFCWQHADMDTASHFPGEHPGRKIGRKRWKNAMDEFCAKLNRR